MSPGGQFFMSPDKRLAPPPDEPAPNRSVVREQPFRRDTVGIRCNALCSLASQITDGRVSTMFEQSLNGSLLPLRCDPAEQTIIRRPCRIHVRPIQDERTAQNRSLKLTRTSFGSPYCFCVGGGKSSQAWNPATSIGPMTL